MKHIGNLEITKENQDKFKDLVEVTGDVRVYGSAKLEAPALQTVGGYVRVCGSAKLEAPALQTVGGYVYVYGSAKLEALQTVGGDVRVCGSAKLEAPNLTTKNDPAVKTKAKEICERALNLSFEAKGLVKIDGILSWLIGKKLIGEITALEIKIVGKLETSFVVQRGNTFSHGETIEKAIEDLRFKISDRDTTKYEHWKEAKEISIDEAIQGYRVITGACEQGVKEFVRTLGELPEKIAPKKIVELTHGRFGNDTLERFLK